MQRGEGFRFALPHPTSLSPKEGGIKNPAVRTSGVD
jgi:hypothetical protein